MAKRIKTEVEKQLIIRMWNTRKDYVTHKEDFESVFGSYADGELMHKAKSRYEKARKALEAERMSTLHKVA